MFKDLFFVATRKLNETDDKVDVLPETQVTVLYSNNDKYYFAVNREKIIAKSVLNQVI